MTKTLFYILEIAGALTLIFGVQPLLIKMGIRLDEAMLEKVTGALVALYFCVIAFIYITTAQ